MHFTIPVELCCLEGLVTIGASVRFVLIVFVDRASIVVRQVIYEQDGACFKLAFARTFYHHVFWSRQRSHTTTSGTRASQLLAQPTYMQPSQTTFNVFVLGFGGREHGVSFIFHPYVDGQLGLLPQNRLAMHPHCPSGCHADCHRLLWEPSWLTLLLNAVAFMWLAAFAII